MLSGFHLDLTLESGQVFRWRRDRDQWWCGVIEPEGIVARIRQTDGAIEIETPDSSSHRLRDYFRIDEPLDRHYRQWEQTGGPEIVDAMASFDGLRVIRQDPWECLVSFQTSPASPIHRIRRSLLKLSEELGEPCGRIGDVRLYRFPTPDALARTPRSLYDEAGFGFRGPNIASAAAIVVSNGGAEWVRSLRAAPYATAKMALMALPGVGEKIADCVCLFSLDKDDAVPIDVHMARVARTLFPNAPATLTPKTYAVVADAFRQRFGEKAGWAQQFLYYAQIQQRGIWDDSLGKHRKPPG